MKKDYNVMVDKELDDFYSDNENSEKRFKLLIEFEQSVYNYEGPLFQLPGEKKKVVKAKEIKLGRRKNKNLF